MAFMLVLFGIMEFSFAVYACNFVADAARDGARWASVRGAASGAPPTTTTISDYVKSRVVAMNRANLRVTSTWQPDNLPGSAVQVRVDYDAPMFINLAMNHPLTVSSTSRIIIMR
jgi:Flp pilus assembly protein TadG